MRYKRSNLPGATYFFTVVTYERKKMLCEGENLQLLKKAFEMIRIRHPFAIDAIVLLPDHLHCLWTLPPNDDDFSTRWMVIKSAFTRICLDVVESSRNQSRIAKRERTVWQRRFWEHQIRDDEDRKRHTDYIHYNPVKHGLVASPREWQFSSFHRYVKDGVYHWQWGSKDRIQFDATVGRE